MVLSPVWTAIPTQFPSSPLVEKNARFLVSKGFSLVHSLERLWGSDSPVSEELSTYDNKTKTLYKFNLICNCLQTTVVHSKNIKEIISFSPIPLCAFKPDQKGWLLASLRSEPLSKVFSTKEKNLLMPYWCCISYHVHQQTELSDALKQNGLTLHVIVTGTCPLPLLSLLLLSRIKLIKWNEKLQELHCLQLAINFVQ